MAKGKVTGIGGIFFKTDDPDKLKSWYEENFGIPTDQYGHSFITRNDKNPDEKNITQWSPMGSDTDYFKPSSSEFMINYRVEHLDDLLKTFASRGIKIIGEPETFEYGKFAWIIDPDGRKIELWEPIDSALL